jgi:cytosine/adenosine deaminase-related metal-dependent hydrolase
VVVEGRNIVEVREGAAANTSADIDLGSALVTPAFVNGHTHVAMNAYRGLASAAAMAGNVVEELFFRIEYALSPGDVEAFARMGAVEAALSGTAVVWDHYYFGLEVARALRHVGIGGVVAPTLQDLSGPGRAALHRALEDTEEIARNTAFGERSIHAALGPHATDTVSDCLFADVSELAARLKLPIHAHVAQTAEEYARSVAAHSKSPVRRLHDLGVFQDAPLFVMAHGLWVSDADLEALAGLPVVLAHCPRSQVQFGFPAPLGRWRQAGLGVWLATDCAASNDGMDIQGEITWAAGGPSYALAASSAALSFFSEGTEAAARALSAARQAHAAERAVDSTPERLLEMVWSGPGARLPQGPAGVIAPGMVAHLAVWAPSGPNLWPLADPLRALCWSNAEAALEGLVVGGSWTIGPTGGRAEFLRRIDYAEMEAEATLRLSHLLQRAGLS